MEIRLEGKNALVTGASKGVGKGIALELARCGCDVAINYHSDREGAEATAAEIRARYQNTFSLIPGYGAQGGKAADIALYMKQGNGGVVNSSRGILLAYKKQPGVAFDEAAYNECVRMREDIQSECNKL